MDLPFFVSKIALCLITRVGQDFMDIWSLAIEAKIWIKNGQKHMVLTRIKKKQRGQLLGAMGTPRVMIHLAAYLVSI